MKTVQNKTAAGKAVRSVKLSAGPDRQDMIEDARDAAAAARLARYAMNRLAGYVSPKSATGRTCSSFEKQAEALENSAHAMMELLQNATAV